MDKTKQDDQKTPQRPLPEGLEEPTDPNASTEDAGVFFQDEKQKSHETTEFAWSLIEAFEETARRLHEHDQIHDVVFSFEEPVPEFNITTVENSLGRELPATLKQFYRITDGLNIHWSFVGEDGEKRPGGAFHVHDFLTTFGYWFDDLWVHDENLDEEALNFRWGLRGLSRTASDEAQPAMTVLYLKEDWGQAHDLFLHQADHALTQIHLDFMSYIFYGLETCGVLGWRHILSDMDVTQDDNIAEQSRQFFETMTLLFPQVDLAPYRELVPDLF